MSQIKSILFIEDSVLKIVSLLSLNFCLNRFQALKIIKTTCIIKNLNLTIVLLNYVSPIFVFAVQISDITMDSQDQYMDFIDFTKKFSVKL